MEMSKVMGICKGTFYFEYEINFLLQILLEMKHFILVK